MASGSRVPSSRSVARCQTASNSSIGSTGEFIRFSYEQRLRIVEVIASETRGRVPILAGAAEANIPVTLEACPRYADMGCRAVSLTGPYYFKVGQESIEEYFRAIAGQSPIDILLYNIPQFANEISLPVVKRLAADCPRIVGIKDCRGSPKVHHLGSLQSAPLLSVKIGSD